MRLSVYLLANICVDSGAVLEETEDIKQLTTELKEKVQARIQGKLKDQRNVSGTGLGNEKHHM